MAGGSLSGSLISLLFRLLVSLCLIHYVAQA